MLYQKLKTFSLKLDDKIKEELTGDKYESVSFSGANFEAKNNIGNRSSFLGILLAKIKLTKIKIVYLSILSFVVDVAITATEQFLIIFGDPAKSFNLLYRQHGLSACPIPYATFKQKQKHAKVFSVAGFTTIILVTAMSSLLVNLMVGPIERTLAASYYWTQNTWASGTSAVTATHNDNRDDWPYYAIKDAGVIAGTELVISSTSGDAGDSTTFDTFDDANTDDETSLRVVTNSVTLLKPNTAACSADNECQSGACCSGVCCAPIYIFVTTATHTGNFGANVTTVRTVADAMCAAEAPSGAQNVHAMMAISDTDSPRDMPTNYGYSSSDPFYWYQLGVGPTSAVGTNFDNIIANNDDISVTQYTGTGINVPVWMGTDRYGTFKASHSCNSWSTTYVFQTGYSCQTGVWCASLGYNSSINYSWLWNGTTSCHLERPIRCMFTW